jgi:DNA-binding SARP family transcriptional activator
VPISFAVLGPLTVSDGSRTVELDPSRPATLLAVLLLHANSVVSPDALCRVVWDDRPPLNGRATVQTCVLRLRRLLAEFGLPEDRIETTAGGYRFPANENNLDLAKFRQLVGNAGRTPVLDGRVVLLRQAMGLWRGHPLPNVRSEALGRDDVGQLIEEWLWAAQQTYTAELQLGHHRELLPELSSVTATYPEHEPLWRLLIEALYTTGRQADALASYDRIRHHLDESLGVSPSPMLQDLQLQILRGEPLDHLDATSPAIAPAVSTPCSETVHQSTLSVGNDQAPRSSSSHLVGRDDQRPALDAQLTGGGARLVGPPGPGRTALAVEDADHFGDRFPDVRFVSPAPLPPDVLPAEVGQPPRCSCLLILDDASDVETNTETASTTSPTSPASTASPTSTCSIVVTSNRSLLALAVRRGPWSHPVAALSHDDGIGVLHRVLGEVRWMSEHDKIVELAEWCAGHPAALRHVAGHLMARPRLPISAYLRASPDRTNSVEPISANQLRDTDPPGRLDQLEPPTASAFLLLAINAGPVFSLATAVQVLAISSANATGLLKELVLSNLIEEDHAGEFSVAAPAWSTGHGLAGAASMDVGPADIAISPRGMDMIR